MPDQSKCQNCGRMVIQKKGVRFKRFCSDACRMSWWYAHRDLLKPRNRIEVECAECHKKFNTVPSCPRKFCSHECYIKNRFYKKPESTVSHRLQYILALIETLTDEEKETAKASFLALR